MIDLNRYCVLRASYYGNNYLCHICRDSILVLDARQCASYCPYGTKNTYSDACLPCQLDNCADIDSTYWAIYNTGRDGCYLLKPTRPIISNFNYNNLFTVSVPNLNATDYSYILTPNQANQTVDLCLNFTRPFDNQTVYLTMNQFNDTVIYDSNRNLIYNPTTATVANNT